MIYDYGPAGTLAPGVPALHFAPASGGGYEWTGSTAGDPAEFTFSARDIVDRMRAQITRLILPPPVAGGLLQRIAAIDAALQSGNGALAINEIQGYVAYAQSNTAILDAALPVPPAPPGWSGVWPSGGTQLILGMPGYLAGLGPAQIVQPVVFAVASSRWECIKNCLWNARVCEPSISFWDVLVCGIVELPALAGSPPAYAIAFFACVAGESVWPCILELVTCIDSCP
jgi:hypothetical protein